MATDQIARAMALDAGKSAAAAGAALAGKADLVNGLVPVSQLPPVAFERVVTVANDAARFALTTDTVQPGDTVKVTATNKMYLVVDTAHLDTEAGYEVYVAGRAAEAVADQNGNVIDQTYATKTETGKLSTGLAACIDGGAKNLLDLTQASSVSKPESVSYQILDDGRLSLSWSGVSGIAVIRFMGIPHIGGELILSGCPSGGGLQTYRADVRQGAVSDETIVKTDDGSSHNAFQFAAGSITYAVRIACENGSAVFSPMLCRPAAWAVTQTYVPYCPSMAELYEMIRDMQQGENSAMRGCWDSEK